MNHERILYGHRGAPAELPENTLPSFVRALERGATAIETDCHLTRDGQVVLSHDPDGRRMARVAREIRDCDIRDVQSWDIGHGAPGTSGPGAPSGEAFRIPTLEEALVELPRASFNVDIKPRDPGAAAYVVRVVREQNAEDRVRLTSFSRRVIDAVKRAGYGGSMGLSRTEAAGVVFLPSALIARVRPPGDALQIPRHSGPFDLARRSLIEKCHALSLRVDYWVINDPDEAAFLLSLGADGIMTDDPARIAPVFAAPTAH